MQIRQVRADKDAAGVIPRAVADAMAGEHAALVRRLRAQVGAPGSAAGAGRRGELLAVGVRALEAAQIAAATHTHTGYEETHGSLFSMRLHRTGQGQKAECHRDSASSHEKISLEVIVRSELMDLSDYPSDLALETRLYWSLKAPELCWIGKVAAVQMVEVYGTPSWSSLLDY